MEVKEFKEVKGIKESEEIQEVTEVKESEKVEGVKESLGNTLASLISPLEVKKAQWIDQVSGIGNNTEVGSSAQTPY